MDTDETARLQQLQRLTPVLLVLYLALGVVSQLNDVFEFFSNTGWLIALLQIAVYGLAALLIWVNKERLSLFHIDRWALFIFLIFGSLWRLFNPSELFVDGLQAVSCAAIAAALFVALRRSRVTIVAAPRAGRWTLLAVFAGLGFGTLGYLLLSWLSTTPVVPNLDVPNPDLAQLSLPRIGALFFYIVGGFISGEVMFRGFLWGYLKDRGWRSRQIWLDQAVLFSFMHFGKFLHDPVSVFTLFISALFLGFFAWKSRSVTPGTISYVLYSIVLILWGTVMR